MILFDVPTDALIMTNQTPLIGHKLHPECTPQLQVQVYNSVTTSSGKEVLHGLFRVSCSVVGFWEYGRLQNEVMVGILQLTRSNHWVFSVLLQDYGMLKWTVFDIKHVNIYWGSLMCYLGKDLLHIQTRSDTAKKWT